MPGCKPCAPPKKKTTKKKATTKKKSTKSKSSGSCSGGRCYKPAPKVGIIKYNFK